MGTFDPNATGFTNAIQTAFTHRLNSLGGAGQRLTQGGAKSAISSLTEKSKAKAERLKQEKEGGKAENLD